MIKGYKLDVSKSISFGRCLVPARSNRCEFPCQWRPTKDKGVFLFDCRPYPWKAVRYLRFTLVPSARAKVGVVGCTGSTRLKERSKINKFYLSRIIAETRMTVES